MPGGAPVLSPARAPGAMASRGRKRKAEAALAAAAKREKPASNREEVAGAGVVIEHWCAARGAGGARGRGSAGA